MDSGRGGCQNTSDGSLQGPRLHGTISGLSQEPSGLFEDSDAKLKGGSSGRPAIVLDRLILRLCEGRQT